VCLNLEEVYIPLTEEIGRGGFSNCESLKSVDFPLLKTLKVSHSFAGCTSLVSVNFPLLTEIPVNGFSACSSLVSATFPLVSKVGNSAFSYSENLRYVSFGTGFAEETEIVFGRYVFSCYMNITPNADLELGENVLPKPNLYSKIW